MTFITNLLYNYTTMRIGLFLNNLDEDYQLSVYKGIHSEAAALGLELICVQGESLPVKDHTAQEESPPLFPTRRLIGADGILFLSSVLFSHKISDSAGQLKKMFLDTPFVSIGDNFFDYHAILINTAKPMWELMEHLLTFHKYKKFLFIGGPAEHPDNVIRETIFREAIEKYRSTEPLLEETVMNGNFLEISGMETIRDYMSSHPDDPPDVIVAANDSMAIGVRNTLLTRGDRRWNKCPVTGFDDISLSGLEAPSLTTIRQPLDELGKLAVRTLFDIIKGKKVPLTVSIEAKLIIRNSCGCPLISTAKIKPNSAYRDMYHLRYISTLGKSLAAINTFDDMFAPWSFFLTNLDIPLFYLIIYEHPCSDIGKEGNLVFERTPANERFSIKGAPHINIEKFFRELGSRAGTSRSWCMSHLRSSTEYLGLVVYQAPDSIHPQLCSGLILLANTVKRLFIYNDDIDRALRLQREATYRARDLLELHNDTIRQLVEISKYCKSLANERTTGEIANGNNATSSNADSSNTDDFRKLSSMIDGILNKTKIFMGEING